MISERSLSRHPLRARSFQLFWIGSTASTAGDYIYIVIFPWLVLQITNSPLALGRIMMAAAIPRALLMLFGGAVSDKLPPRLVMMISGLLRMVLVGGISSLLWFHALRIWQLYAFEACFGIFDAFADPAAQSLLPHILEPEQLPPANSIIQSTRGIISLVAPTPVALLMNIVGMAWMVAADAFSFLFILGALWMLPSADTRISDNSTGSVFQSLMEGLKYVKDDPALRSMMLFIAALNFAIAGPLGIGLPLIAKNEFGSSLVFGALLSSLAAGGVVGSLLAGLRHHKHRGMLVLALGMVTGFLLLSIAFIHQAVTMSAALFMLSLATAYLNVHLITWFQQQVRSAMIGRVMSVLIFASVGLNPFSFAIAGSLLAWSRSGVFLAAGILVLCVVLFAALQESVRDIH